MSSTTAETTALATRAAEVAGSLDLKTLGEVFARSGYFDDARQASQAIVKILYGGELGVPPVTAMMGIYIINGKPSASAGLLASRIKGSKRYGYKIRRLDNQACELDIYEDGEVVGSSNFTVEDARTAGALDGRNKHTWKAFPRNMLFARAISNACRWYCADLFGGSPVYTPEEMGALVNDEGAVVVEAEGRYVPTRERDPDPGGPPASTVVEMVVSADSRVWRRWLEIKGEAEGLGVRVSELRLPVALDELAQRANKVQDAIAARMEQLAEQETAAAAGKAAHDTASNGLGQTVDTQSGEVLSEKGGEAESAEVEGSAGAAPKASKTQEIQERRSALWQENRRLVARAVELGVQGDTLNARVGEDVIANANQVLSERIKNAELDRQLAAEQDKQVGF